MTISVTDAALDMEKKAMKRCTRRSPFRSWLAWTFCGMFLTSITGFYVFWYTNVFANYVSSFLVLRNGTRSFDWWVRPPMKFMYKLHVFNYTNVDEFEAGNASKLHVQDLGPYIYEESLERVNVTMHDENGTVTYQERRSYKWVGGRPETDSVTVPNVLLFFATAMIRNLNFGVRLVTNSVLLTLQEKPFVKVTAGGFLWGYETKLFDMAKPLMQLQRDIPFDKFGLLAKKKAIDKDRIMIHTGLREINNLGMIDRLNGEENRDIWGDERCDRISGSDSNLFPPNSFANTNKPIYIYSKDLCVKLPFRFSEETTVYDLPCLTYKMEPLNYSQPENHCFCPKTDDGSRICPPAGLLNISSCIFNSPLLSSFPHFYNADESLLEQVDGLNPQQKIHESYINIHPRFGLAIAGWSRLQVNLDVRKATGTFIGRLKDGQILPLIWIENGLDELPDTVLNELKTSHVTTVVVEKILQWSALTGMIISLIALIFYFWKYRAGMDEKIIEKNTSGRHPLLRLL
ncbi:scavenger receptor class B member 1-like [Pseudomyrmex gracilis]|uniref:scavenger receptor class B member 1-like n=1 Tax=Pseudomyrmex gracilis TaxID=219809 RepID=UPI000995C2B9|nr:scavenger receptor class B member 1-like [Pseudomyrmex gracilis]